MLESTFNGLYSLLLSLFGYATSTPPNLIDMWLILFSLIATIAVLLLPFYIVYKVVRWLCA